MTEKPFNGNIYKDTSSDNSNKKRATELTPSTENIFQRVVRPVDILRSMGFNPLEPLQRFETDEMLPKQIADVDVRALEKMDTPNIILNMPHAGEFVPECFWSRMTEDGKKSTAKLDAGTAYIYRSSEMVNIQSRISRWALDLNRKAHLEDVQPENSPGSLIWKSSIAGTPVYAEGQEPSHTEEEEFATLYYDAYYEQLNEAIYLVSKRNEGGRTLVIDGHSFPPEIDDIKGMWEKYRPYIGDMNPSCAPLFVLADKQGLSCDEDIKASLVVALQESYAALSDEEKAFLNENGGIDQSEIVSVDKYLDAGAYNSEFFGNRRKHGEHINMIQIEANEAAFIDFSKSYFDAQYDFGKLDIVQKLLEKSLLKIAPLLRGETTEEHDVI